MGFPFPLYPWDGPAIRGTLIARRASRTPKTCRRRFLLWHSVRAILGFGRDSSSAHGWHGKPTDRENGCCLHPRACYAIRGPLILIARRASRTSKTCRASALLPAHREFVFDTDRPRRRPRRRTRTREFGNRHRHFEDDDEFDDEDENGTAARRAIHSQRSLVLNAFTPPALLSGGEEGPPNPSGAAPYPAGLGRLPGMPGGPARSFPSL